MTTPVPASPPSAINPWLKPLFPPEINELLSLVPDAAVLVDRTRGILAAANHAFLVLTAFDLREVVGASISSLIENFDLQEALQKETCQISLKRRMREAIEVELRPRILEGSHNLCLLLLRGLDEQAAATASERVNQALITLASLPQNNDDRSDHSLAISAVREATQADYALLYLASPEDPYFHREMCIGGECGLPETFPPADMTRLAEAQVWQPGKRMYVDLHKAARVEGLSFVASVPLGQDGIWVGLLVVSGRQSAPADIAKTMTLFGAQITRMLDQQLLVSELQRQIGENSQTLHTARIVDDNMSEGVIVVDPQMVILSINAATEWMLGYAEWEVTGYTLDNILIGPDIVAPTLTSAEQGLLLNPINNATLHRRNGTSFPAKITVVPSDETDKPQFLVVFIQDVSENEEIRQKTAQLEQRAILGEVTAVFAHEVRNPVNNIYSGLQLMAAGFGEDTSTRKDIDRLIGDCNRLNHLMESVLNFSRSNKYTFEKVDIQMLIRRVLDRWRPRLTNQNINAFFSAANDTPAVAGDPRALDQVIQNLVRNASEAMEGKGGNLAIRVDPVLTVPNRPQVMITLSDDGPGIPDEVRERIFEPFVTTKTQGTGLGLAVIKRIITAHHGWIRVNSFPGATMFEIMLLAYKE